MSSGYEEQELSAIDAALDANPDATSNEVFQATRPFDERAIASVAASRALAGGGGGSSPVLLATKTIAHADILTLPSASVEIIPAPASPSMIIPIQAFTALKSDDGIDYTNIDSAAQLRFTYTPLQGQLDQLLVYVAETAAHSGVSLLLAAGMSRMMSYTALSTPDTDGFVYPRANAIPPDVLAGAPLLLGAFNAASGDFTGGDPANVLIVSVLYYLLDWPT